MKVAVIGCGYVGLTAAVALAGAHEVVAADCDAKKIASLVKGQLPFYEAGLAKMLAKNKRRLTFTTSVKEAVRNSEVVMCAVAKDAELKKVTGDFARYADGYKIFINKTTVPVGINAQMEKLIRTQNKKLVLDYLFQPEFLREGSALDDFLKPERVIVGLATQQSDAIKNHGAINRATKIFRQIYGPIFKKGCPLLFTTLEEAEMIKYGSNAFLAARISLINEFANFCEIKAVDIVTVTKGMGLDPRIGSTFLQAGIGFGGSCLPKDLEALLKMGTKAGFDFALLEKVRLTNQNQPQRFLRRFKKIFPLAKGKTVAIWGVAFKANTDDLREAPSLKIIKELLQLKVKVRIHDALALEKARKIFGNVAEYYQDYYRPLAEADALFILTEDNAFRKADLKKMRRLMRDHYIFDGRNILDKDLAAKAGFDYYGVGR